MAPAPKPISKIPNGSITLRYALPTDAPEIVQLGTKVFVATFGHSMPATDLQTYLNTDYSVAAISATLSNPLITTLVAVPSQPHSQDGVIVGFAQLREGTVEPCISEGDMPTLELQRLYVSTEWSGKGVGKALMQRAEDIARERGARTLWLGVWEDNLRAQGMYGKLGFRRVGEHDFVLGECVQTDWIMCKNL